MIPLPFSRGICTVSEAMSVPADADNNELETYRLRLEEQLNRISRECDIKMGLIPDEPGVCKIKPKKMDNRDDVYENLQRLDYRFISSSYQTLY